MNAATLLSLLVFLPTLGAIVLAFFPREKDEAARYFALAVTAATFLLSVYMFFAPESPTYFQLMYEGQPVGWMQSAIPIPWIPTFDIDYFMGVDGISFPLVMLTTFICVLAMGASFSIHKHVKAYCILFLILETAMIGVFLALNFILFFVFWEVMLLPMYFLIGVWGGLRREYAAIKFFIYTLAGGVLMLIAILLLYFNSNLNALAQVSDLNGNTAAAVRWDSLHLADEVTQQVRVASGGLEAARPIHTFNLLALAAMAQHTDVFSRELQWWTFMLLFVGFIIKVPSVPVHTWLPDAHVEAPTPISMILAGVLLKMGGYGIIRICYPICPAGGFDWRYVVCAIGVISMVYGAFAALAQKDFKRMVAYSSVSHMGYVVLGLGVWSATGPFYIGDYWNMGTVGAMFQMIGHGVSSAGMFFMVGVIYDRVHHRNLNEFGGLFSKMPVYTALSIGIFFAGLGLPGLCGFWGEVFVVLSVWRFSPTMAIISAAVVVLTAGYILWAVQRVYLGAEYKGPHPEALIPSNMRENLIAGVLFVSAIVLGVFPYHTVIRYMQPTIDRQIDELTAWTVENRPTGSQRTLATEPAGDLNVSAATMRSTVEPALPNVVRN
jgi:NADH-quinone oxidoreductase subunit M